MKGSELYGAELWFGLSHRVRRCGGGGAHCLQLRVMWICIYIYIYIMYHIKDGGIGGKASLKNRSVDVEGTA